jgi:hypothetical protein
MKLHHTVIALELEVLQVELATDMQDQLKEQLRDSGLYVKKKNLERMLDDDNAKRNETITGTRRREREQKQKGKSSLPGSDI